MVPKSWEKRRDLSDINCVEVWQKAVYGGGRSRIETNVRQVKNSSLRRHSSMGAFRAPNNKLNLTDAGKNLGDGPEVQVS